MKIVLDRLMKNKVFIMLINGVVAYIVLTAVIISILQIPSNVIFDSGLTEILLVFEDFPDETTFDN